MRPGLGLIGQGCGSGVHPHQHFITPSKIFRVTIFPLRLTMAVMDILAPEHSAT